MEIGCGAWRGTFVVDEKRVEIISLDAAYPLNWIQDEARTKIADREAQEAFLVQWPSSDGTGETPELDGAP